MLKKPKKTQNNKNNSFFYLYKGIVLSLCPLPFLCLYICLYVCLRPSRNFGMFVIFEPLIAIVFKIWTV